MTLSHEDLISPVYAALQLELHSRPGGYGAKGSRWVRAVLDVKEQHRCRTILDYGCGQGSLSAAIRVATGSPCFEYDPAVRGKQATPPAADLVVCTDVLEHVEPEKLTNVLRHLRSLTRKALFVSVSLVEAGKVLADGRNAHLTVMPEIWWRDVFVEAGFKETSMPDVPAAVKPSKAWTSVQLPC